MNLTDLDERIAGAAPGTPALLGLPFDANSSFLRGPAEAPAAIRAAILSPSSNPWTETGVDLGISGVWVDAGDLAFDDAAQAFDAIESSVERVLARGLRPVSLGGDHSVTYPVLRAFARHGRDVDVLHFDAHPDLYDELDGNRYSHACPFARVMEEGLARRLVQVGIRTMNAHQRAQAERFGVEVVEMRDFRPHASFGFQRPVYVSFDLDALDPAFAPGVSHHEAGGLSTREALSIIHAIGAPIAGADVVELNPRRDSLGITAAAAAKIVRELLGMMISSR